MSLGCHGIYFSNDGIQGGSVRVRREDIRRISVGSGFISPHPFLQTVFGVVLLMPGYFAARHFIHWAFHGGPFFEAEVWFVVSAAIGLWLISTALKRGV